MGMISVMFWVCLFSVKLCLLQCSGLFEQLVEGLLLGVWLDCLAILGEQFCYHLLLNLECLNGHG